MAISQVHSVSSDFVCLIVNKFDQHKFPTVSSLEQPAISTNITDCVPDEVAQALPPEIHGVLGLYATNFNDWLVMSGILDPRIAPRTLDNSARGFLEKMAVTCNEPKACDQLKTYVFEEAFGQFSNDEKIICFKIMNDCGGITKRWPFKMRLLIFRVQVVVATVFANPVVTTIMGLVIAWQSAKIYRFTSTYVVSHANKYYVPKIINKLINDAPSVARVVSNCIGVIDHVYKRQLPYQIVLWAATHCVRKVAPPYETWVEHIKSVVLLPTAIVVMPGKIFDKTLALSYTLQQRISNLSQKSSDSLKDKIIKEDTVKAYHLWMHLLANPKDFFAANV